MSFIIPDWGGGDSFSYHEDLEDPSILSSKSSKCLLANLKKKKKRKRTEDNKLSQQIPQPRQIEESINSSRQNDDALSASQASSLLFPNKSSEKKTDKKKKKKVPKIKGTGDQIYGISKNINSEDTGTTIGNGSTNDNVGLAEQLVIKTCRKKKRKKKKKNNNKYSELNAKQKKENNTQDSILSNISSTVNKSLEYNKADVNVTCVFNSKLLTGARIVGEHGVDSKASCTTKKKKKNKKGKSSSMNECKVHSGIFLQPSNFTEPDDQMLSGENNEESVKIDNRKRSKNNSNKNIGDSQTCVEFMGNKMKDEKLSSEVEIPKKSKKRNQLSNKQNKKNEKMETEDTGEDLIFEADDDDDCDPKFQSDFKTLLKELDFEMFHNSQAAKKKKMHLNDKSSASDMTIVHADKKNFARKEKLSSEDYIDSEHLDSDFEIDNEYLDTNRKSRHKNVELIEKNTKYGKIIGKDKGNIREKKQGKIDACETSSPKIDNEKKMDKNKLAEMLEEAKITRESKPLILSSAEVLRQKMTNQLAVARFRMVNEALYTSSSLDAVKMFTHDHEAFKDYHAGYQAQVKRWPVNPQDLIVQWLCKKPKEWVVADFGCGEAVLSLLVPQQKVHSLDLVATNSRVTACDMAHTPLNSASVDVVVFCLSLMGTNIKDFIVEANRVLKEGGIMKIAEVESRFGDVQQFLNLLVKFGFHCIQKDTNGKYFFLFEFKKIRKLKKTIALPNINLKPCIYKKR